MDDKMDSIISKLKNIFLMYGDTTSFNIINTWIINEKVINVWDIQFQNDENLNIKVPVAVIDSKKISFFKPAKMAMSGVPLPIIEEDSKKIMQLLNQLHYLSEKNGKQVRKFEPRIDDIDSTNSINLILDELKRIYEYYNDKLDFPRIMGYIVNSPELYITHVNVEKTKLFDISIYLPIGKFVDNDSEELLTPDNSLIAIKSEGEIKNDSKYIADLINQLINIMTKSE
ncbi:hypothetical protein FHL06_10075 [Lactobacillus halodurans]|uniref:Uncharacterized protein n=1 Tax=Companilactobacillus halodurans TaxID=2584183 RepID=A0A5P0ZR93_9LACO|nr:hypothetical protein [Companilactobacillus halodurans]MQS76716.1 hypothetical protein [Companilactobacillus halodurans]